MAPTRAFSAPISTNEKVSAAAFNQLDDGQFWALTRNGTAALLAASAVDLGAFDFTFVTGGVGRVICPADRLTFSGTSWPTLGSRSVTSWAPPAAPVFADTEFGLITAGLQQKAASVALNFYLTLPIDAVVTAIKLPVNKATADSGLPGVMPTIALTYIDLATGSVTSVGSVADTSGSEGAYESHHLISLTGLSHTVAVGRKYILTITGDDTSSGAADGLKIYWPLVDLTVTSLRTV
jgi:hypothetical protein